MSELGRFQAIVLAAVGVEKLLKFIVASVNPALVLKSHDFDSIVVSCHMDRGAARDRVQELEKKGSRDVITLKAAIQRASLFCDAVKGNAQFIHALADLRDIALHRPTQEIDSSRARSLLCRDFYNVIREIASSLNLSQEYFLQEHCVRLAQLSHEISEQDNFIAKMEALLDVHRTIWARRSENPTTVSNAERLTQVYLTRKSDVTECPCPACGNVAVATLEPEFDHDSDDGHVFGYVSGVYVTEVQCLFCSLRLDQYDQLNFVDADALLSSDERI